MHEAKWLRGVSMALAVVLAMGCGGEQSPDEAERWVGSYLIPSDEFYPPGQAPYCQALGAEYVHYRMGEGFLGVIGYFHPAGEPHTLPTSEVIFPEFYLPLSARAELDSGEGFEVNGRITFSGDELQLGFSKRLRVGALEYVVTIVNLDTLQHEGMSYFHMCTLRVMVDALRAEGTPGASTSPEELVKTAS
ncbi:hypothetical protein [Stigmatella erecta]|uniref:Lipoprotein n=1 Tax=Stigmatella erecta TaxID=83460 RepID=A0A1I0I297_9BACT|nr:hypothetical protein [Stigmatella erecta]SET89733.1 hypothetical protein SAMN05443639_105213 [Stigmatella erecta]